MKIINKYQILSKIIRQFSLKINVYDVYYVKKLIISRKSNLGDKLMSDIITNSLLSWYN